MNKHGLTLVELITVLALLSVLMVTLTRLYSFQMDLWAEGYERQSADQQMDRSIDRILRSLRPAQSIDDFSESSISFSADLGGGVRAYRLYLYSADDALPAPPYTAASYELRLAETDLDYGDGQILATNIEPPDDPAFVRTGDLISIDLTQAYLDMSQRWRTNVQLRNL